MQRKPILSVRCCFVVEFVFIVHPLSPSHSLRLFITVFVSLFSEHLNATVFYPEKRWKKKFLVNERNSRRYNVCLLASFGFRHHVRRFIHNSGTTVSCSLIHLNTDRVSSQMIAIKTKTKKLQIRIWQSRSSNRTRSTHRKWINKVYNAVIWTFTLRNVCSVTVMNRNLLSYVVHSFAVVDVIVVIV